jgi:hypothetical protein
MKKNAVLKILRKTMHQNNFMTCQSCILKHTIDQMKAGGGRGHVPKHEGGERGGD